MIRNLLTLMAGIHMIKHIACLISLLFLGSLSHAVAQERISLTIEDCIQLGLQKSKALKISQTKVTAAEARSSETDVARYPTLKFFGSYSRLSEVDPFTIPMPSGPITISQVILNNYVLRATAQQTLFSGFRLQKTSSVAEFNAAASSEDFNKDKSQFVLDVKSAYWNYYRSRETSRAMRENLVQAKAHLDDIEKFFGQGLATTNEVLKVKVQISNISVSLIDAENGEELARMSLNNTIGLPLQTEIDLRSTAEYSPRPDNEVTLALQNALQSRPEIRGMEQRVRAGEAGVSLARAGWFPQINATANYYYSRPNSRIFPSKDAFMDTWDIGINLSYDIWNWRTSAFQTEQAQANLEQSRYVLEQLKDAVQLELYQSSMTVEKSKQKISASTDAVKQAEENYRITNDKFKTGLAINSDLLDAETALLQAKINYTGAVADYEIAIARYEKAAGK